MHAASHGHEVRLPDRERGAGDCTNVHDGQLSPELRPGEKFKLQIVTASLSAHLRATHGALWRASRPLTHR